jgi:hypothetical protein
MTREEAYGNLISLSIKCVEDHECLGRRVAKLISNIFDDFEEEILTRDTSGLGIKLNSMLTSDEYDMIAVHNMNYVRWFEWQGYTDDYILDVADGKKFRKENK